jgi:hypothetical protein
MNAKNENQEGLSSVLSVAGAGADAGVPMHLHLETMAE